MFSITRARPHSADSDPAPEKLIYRLYMLNQLERESETCSLSRWRCAGAARDGGIWFMCTFHQHQSRACRKMFEYKIIQISAEWARGAFLVHCNEITHYCICGLVWCACVRTGQVMETKSLIRKVIGQRKRSHAMQRPHQQQRRKVLRSHSRRK